jgi:hypothetical protein
MKSRYNPYGLPNPSSDEAVATCGRFYDDEKVYDCAYKMAVKAGLSTARSESTRKSEAGIYANTVLAAVQENRKAAKRAGLRVPSAYSRSLASMDGQSADDDEVWGFAFEEASAAGLSDGEAEEHADIALRMVRARERALSAAKAAGKKPGSKKVK